MLAFIQGIVTEIANDYIVLNNHGLGWLIYYAHCQQLKKEQDVQIYTYLAVSENDMRLYGFSSLMEKELFLNLISVKGLGPKTVMNIFQKVGLSLITNAIASGDVSALKKLPGIGAKSASQIILDLKGKLDMETYHQDKKDNYPLAIEEALNALKNFGYRASDLNLVGNKMLEQETMTTEECIRFGLQFFAQK